MPMVSGDGPRDEPNAVRNSKLPTLSALDIDEFDGLVRPRPAVSERRDGGRGIAMLLPEVGVGICRLSLLTFAEGGADTLKSPISEKMSPRSAYLQTTDIKKYYYENQKNRRKSIELTWMYSTQTALGFVTAHMGVMRLV